MKLTIILYTDNRMSLQSKKKWLEHLSPAHCLSVITMIYIWYGNTEINRDSMKKDTSQLQIKLPGGFIFFKRCILSTYHHDLIASHTTMSWGSIALQSVQLYDHVTRYIPIHFTWYTWSCITLDGAPDPRWLYVHKRAVATFPGSSVTPKTKTNE